MLDPQHMRRIAQAIPFLQEPNSELAVAFQRRSYHVRIPAGREIFAEGDHVDGIALLISGEVRVHKIGESGREITLYRFGGGESCVITATAILNTQSFPAIAVVERDAEAVMVSADDFRDWVRRYDPWREFVFNMISQRLASVIEIVDEVAFQRMDRRIAALLLERGRSMNPIRVTHQEIANDLGSSREVVSRLLQDFVEKSIVRLSRGAITVLDFERLENYRVL